ncbi:ABC transporter substrate-binding protein [uncultured Sphingomonas sp.]|uniref:ABC transporter substrate-binding protein n=1 Tax=uncultured Sphingomonas sp. TaxID=158754 RepID=UPI0025D9FE36|nr:ABC transporter substrate-binding protein [uncultured Sphingomonas sp.]
MRRPAPLAAVLLFSLNGCGSDAGPATPTVTPHPMRVMSMNQCTDQLVLALLPPSQIASVSWLSRDPVGSLMAARAAKVEVNHGSAEEVLAQKPDLVVAGSFTTPALRAMLKRLGYPLIEVDHANSVADIRRITRQVARAVGEPARGEALIARMDAQLAALARRPGPAIRVVAWDRTGFAAGEGTLYDAILQAAGARNLVREPATLSYRKPNVEVLLRANPALLVQGTADAAQPGLGDDLVRHRVVRQYWRGRTLPIAQGYYVCGTPMIAEAAARLRAGLRTAITRSGPAVPIKEMIR